MSSSLVGALQRARATGSANSEKTRCSGAEYECFSVIVACCNLSFTLPSCVTIPPPSGSLRFLSGRQRMMFVHDAPPAVNLAKTYGQPKFERFTSAAGANADAPSYCRGKSNILAACYLPVLKSKGDRFFRRPEKRLPSCHVVI